MKVLFKKIKKSNKVALSFYVVTALLFIFFTIVHFPCGTTIVTIKKETNSLLWTIISIIIPTLVGIICCFILSNLLNLIF